MESLLQDIRYGFRVLVKSPAFTVVAVIALALGIGANTAIFSVVNAVLLKELPYRDSSRLVMVWERSPRGNQMNVVSPANYFDWQEQNSVFEDMSMFLDFRFNLTGVDQPEELPGQIAEVDLFSLLGANPELGRTFAPEHGIRGAENVVILSNGLWHRLFAGDRDVIDKTIMLDGSNYKVIGVMPEGFQLYVKQGSMIRKPVELWVPMRPTPEWRIRRGRAWMAVARLKPGVTHEQAQADMDGIAARFEEQYPNFNKGWGVNVVPIAQQFSGEVKTALLILLGAVGFVLLIACANVANLLLARSATRQKEMAIRSALGAGRWRVVRQLLTESIILSLIGGATGLVLALWGTEALVSLSPKDLLGVGEVTLDRRILLFTGAVTVLTGLIFGIVPALAATRTNLNDVLKEGGRDASGGARSQRVRSMFVVLEVALALVLLVGSGLMMRSLLRLQSVDPGFDPSKLLTARLLLPGQKYQKESQRIDFFKQLVDRMAGTPGVVGATAIDWLPFAAGNSATGFTIEGQPPPEPGNDLVCDVRVSMPNYFELMKIPFLAGRTFTEREATELAHVVVINQTMADRYFPGENPLGQRVRISMMDEPAPCEIIGIVGDSKHASLDVSARATAYWPHPELARNLLTIVLRTEGDPLTLAGTLQQEVRNLDKDQPIADVSTMEQLISQSMSRTRFTAVLLAVFAGVALALAAVGIYGVMSYSVEQMTREIGIRMALGASRRDVVSMIVRSGMVLSVAGVGIGLIAAYGLTRFLTALLYQVSATDATSFIAIPFVLSAVALVACLVPAIRATRVDPMVALRYE